VNQRLNSSHAGKITAMETKRELRLRISQARPHSSAGLTEQLIALTLELKPEIIASYSPLESEPNVSKFNLWALENNYQLLLPKVSGSGLEFGAGKVAKGSFGIQEPIEITADSRKIDLMLIPAMAVDDRGFRLGKGKGFYDRFLEAARPSRVFAVIFAGEHVSVIETEPHDQKVDGFITPDNTTRFSF
jgi:5-formyltetrahydrofolate cyclo-ligase